MEPRVENVAAVIPPRTTSLSEDPSSMKSLFASLEPGECRRIEEEFEKLTNESAVDVQDPDAKLEEILAENISSAKNKVIVIYNRYPIFVSAYLLNYILQN